MSKIIEMPKMHWEIGTPDEQILEFVQTMKRNMERCVTKQGFFGLVRDREAEAYVHAYETVERHILQYQRLWRNAAGTAAKESLPKEETKR